MVPVEACQNPTPLFHLIQTLSKNNRYFPLLSKENNLGESLIAKLFELLDQKSLNNEMERQVMVIIHALLKTPNYEGSVGKGDILTIGKR